MGCPERPVAEHCEDCRRRLAGLMEATLEVASGDVEAVEVDAAPPPARIGPDYELVELVGSGAIGAVYRARRTRGGEDVALKLIGPEHCDDRSRQRFARETQALGALRHPSVVRVLDSGPTPDGGLFLAMELLSGKDLLRTIRESGPLPVDEVVRLGIEAADALAATHRAGFVHRDLKPANLFLRDDGRLALLDYGLAVPMALDEEARLTGSGVLLGTPAYMAVEQAMGRRDEDARTDVWGLGATLYHAVAGRTPFHAATVTAQLVRVVTDDPSPLPEAVPRWLSRILLRALAKDRADRWPSMDALGAALREGQAGHASDVRAPPPGIATAITLEDEVRIVSLLLGNEVADVEAFRRAVAAEQGTAYPLLGRRAIGVFGGEAWRGDEAERAVRAGLAVHAAGAASLLAVATGRAFRARAGALTGDVVAAAQLVLRREGVGVDPETLRRIRGGFAVTGDLATAVRPGRRVLGAAGPGGSGSPFAGRDRELADLVASARQAAAERQASGVVVVGPPGIGKTRLVAEVLTRLETELPDSIVLEAAGESNRTLEGWHALATALRAHLQLPPGSTPARVRSRLLETCPSRRAAEFLGEILGADFPLTPPLANARSTPGVMPDQIVLAIGDVLEAAVRRAPVILVLEDAQWADARSLAAIDVLLRRLDRSPLFVVATARGELEALADLRRLALDGISRAATRTILASIAGDDLELARAESLHDRSGGNPFFAQELARALREGREDLPASIGAAMQARLDVLPREHKDLLRRASVLGARFWEEGLASLGSVEVGALLAALRRRDLVQPEPRPRLAGTSEWRFRHALVQEVAYASLTAEQRTALHRQAADWLAARADAPALEVARHLEAIDDPAAAAPWLQRAAQSAWREGDGTAALLASARALPYLSGPAVFALRRIRADLLFFLGRPREHQLEADALESLATTDAELMIALHNRVRALSVQGRRADAIDVGLRALRIDPDDVDVLCELTLTLMHGGPPLEAMPYAERALAIATSRGDDRQRGRALRILAGCHETRGDFGPAFPLLDQALAAFEASGNPKSVATIRLSIAYNTLSVGRHERARDALEQARLECRAVGNLLAEGYAVETLGQARARCGDVAGGLAAEDEALAIGLALGEHRLEMAARTVRAAILVEAGRAAEAVPVLAEVLAFPEERLGEFAPALHALSAVAFVALGEKARARVHAERALALREQLGGMEQFEAYAFVAADECGIDGALETGTQVLLERAARLPDAEMRADFLERVPDNARLHARARASGLTA